MHVASVTTCIYTYTPTFVSVRNCARDRRAKASTLANGMVVYGEQQCQEPYQLL